MGGFGKVRAWLAAAVVFLGGALMLMPSQASAQFNIEGMIRGAMGGYHGGYRYHSSRHYSRHEHEASRHSRHERDDDGDKADKTKEKDATKDEAASANAGTHAQPSGGSSGDVGPSEPTAAPQKPSNTNKPTDDQPAFSPAR
jgi:hypothetical protein